MENGINRFGNKPNGLGKQKSLINGTEGCRLSSSLATASIQHPMYIHHLLCFTEKMGNLS